MKIVKQFTIIAAQHSSFLHKLQHKEWAVLWILPHQASSHPYISHMQFTSKTAHSELGSSISNPILHSLEAIELLPNSTVCNWYVVGEAPWCKVVLTDLELLHWCLKVGGC
jgi:hypothetical protein